MTRNQLAMTVNADEKWIENTLRLLGVSVTNEQVDSVWLGLVRLFNHDIGLALGRSAELATEALGQTPETREVKLGEGREASVTLDVARYHSRHNAAKSAALVFGGPRRRGRKLRAGGRNAVTAAEDYGVDVNALRHGLNESAALRLQRLEENALFINDLRR